MACPNKKDDEMIIAEIARRKAVKEDIPVPEYTYEHLTFDGDLQFILMSGVDQNDIVTITNAGNGQWDVMYIRRR